MFLWGYGDHLLFLCCSHGIHWNPLLRRSQGVTQQLFERLGRQLLRRAASRRPGPGAAVGGAQDVVAVVVVPQAPAAHAWDGWIQAVLRCFPYPLVI